MTKFSTGLIAGGIIGVAGLAYAMRDRRVRKSVMREGRRMASKAGDKLHNISDMF